jgi:hypothetical protein
MIEQLLPGILLRVGKCVHAAGDKSIGILFHALKLARNLVKHQK